MNSNLKALTLIDLQLKQEIQIQIYILINFQSKLFQKFSLFYKFLQQRINKISYLSFIQLFIKQILFFIFYQINRNWTLSNEQIAQLNTTLVQCEKLESLKLNLKFSTKSLKQENLENDQFIQSSDIYSLLHVRLIVNTISLNLYFKIINDQIYTQIQFFHRIFYNEFQACEEPKSIETQGNILLEETMSNLINLNSLQLNLDGNQIEDEGAVWICTILNRCKALTNLNLQLWKNNMGNKGISSIVEGISSCANPTTLTLNAVDNKIGDKGAQNIGLGLSNCTQLTNLDIGMELNQIGNRIEQKYSHIQMHSEQILKNINFYFIQSVTSRLNFINCVQFIFYIIQFFL
ncbi:transmembrane protein, putative (macronuclear) [Tetrahymena thermophila SB210]|uniref:Transmembrane protein, putative n=1 Tax=Tetrahymena thermophila (strain SB210) TaxID=312017 RepID=W7X0F3_TETTS|nr:transmembrane protein, putative [Tetrahymena thermophila SB210]EWS72600.1 transmembrane protein, putative [Tetrahymena thermophila SB210]|eukprot:XP_012654883.1 transmembrane protein, putative [Tetrahymena thermophila SB210]